MTNRPCLSLMLLIAGCNIAYADDVGVLNQFTSGNVISSGEVNKNFDDIKTAVNSKQSDLKNGCAQGYAIRSIDHNGNVECEFDDIGSGTGGGDITGVTAGTGLLGGGDTGTVELRLDTAAVTGQVNTTLGAKANTNPLNHDRYSDANAVTAMGAKANGNALNHNRYTDNEALAAVNPLLPAVKEAANPFGSGTAITGTPSAPQNLTSLTVTPPADGNVMYMVTGRMGINQASAVYNYAYISLNTSSTAVDQQYLATLNLNTTGGTNTLLWTPLALTRVVSVRKGVANTIYVMGYRDQTGSGLAYIGPAHVTALFLPTLLP